MGVKFILHFNFLVGLRSTCPDTSTVATSPRHPRGRLFSCLFASADFPRTFYSLSRGMK